MGSRPGRVTDMRNPGESTSRTHAREVDDPEPGECFSDDNEQSSVHSGRNGHKLQNELVANGPNKDQSLSAPPGAFMIGGLYFAAEGASNNVARSNRVATPSDDDDFELFDFPGANTLQDSFPPALRGGQGEVPGRQRHEAVSTMNPDRAALLLSNSLSNNAHRDLYEKPPPAPNASSARKTGGNLIPLGPRGPSRNTGQDGRAPAPIMNREFDFNSTDQLPRQTHSFHRDSQTFEFAKCNDAALLEYLSARRISTGFLFEVDQFLRSHPEIARYAPQFLKTLYTSPPLHAYLHFLKGYTRPARYIDGIITTAEFAIPAGFQPACLRDVPDPELDDFFEGFEYRHDILDRIDKEVFIACNDIRIGRGIAPNLRRLVCYAVWGNPVDAYKYYEYSYQQEYMPHRYLPEHVVLGEIPKPRGYTEPTPTSIRGWRRHREVRYRMARAKDQGVDVLDVLMSEYRLALIKRGLRRVEIDSMCARAQDRLDDERRYPRGVDIVDMIMDEAVSRPYLGHPSVQVIHQPVRQACGPSTRAYFHQLRHVGHPRPRPVRDPLADNLRGAKTVLSRLYAQEASAFASTGNGTRGQLSSVQNRRGVAEKMYVNALVNYGMARRTMSARDATELQKTFAGKKKSGRVQAYKDYLLNLYPRELN